jgi:uncharacterized protein (TIGR00304 family)
MKREIGWSAFAALAVAAVAMGAVATDAGQLSLYLVCIFPVLQAEGLWGVGAVLCALASFVVLFLTFFEVSPEEMGDSKVSTGGVVLIGPFPIVFGTDRRVTVIALLITVVVLASLVLFLLL